MSLAAFAQIDVAIDQNVRKHRHLHKGFAERSVQRNLAWVLSTFFQAQRAQLLQKLEFDRNFEKVWADVVQTTNARTVGSVAMLLRPAYLGGASAVSADLGRPVPEIDKEWADLRAKALLDMLNDTTRKAVIRAITKSQTVKEADDNTTFEIPAMDPSQFSDAQQAVQAQFDDFLGSRANTISRNEAAVAYERGGTAVIDALQQQGLNFQKAWDGDADLCEELCAPNVDADWIAMDDAFPSGDTEPPAHPNCGCTCLYEQTDEPQTDEQAQQVDSSQVYNQDFFDPQTLMDTAQAMASLMPPGLYMDSIGNYAGAGYQGLNFWMRTGEIHPQGLASLGTKTAKGLTTFRDNLSDAIQNYGLRLDQSTTVFRRGILDEMKPGDIFTDKGFVSTSGNSFYGKVGNTDHQAMQILLPKGTPVAIGSDSEKELILDHGSRFRYDGVTSSGTHLLTYLGID